MGKERWYPEEEFFLNEVNLDKVFSMVDRSEYLLIYYLRRMEERRGSGGSVYLTELAEEMNLTIPEVSKIVQRLQDKGHIDWKTDVERGRTYIQLTSAAKRLVEDQKNKLTVYYKRIQEEIPQEDLQTTLRTVRRILDMMTNEKEVLA